MKIKLWLALVMCFFTQGVAPALAETQVLVARVKGDVKLKVKSEADSYSAAAAQMVVPPVKASLDPQEELLLVYTSDGHQEVLQGPGEFDILEGQCTTKDGKISRGKAVSRQSISISGQNLNRVGGARQRTGSKARYQLPGDIPVRGVYMKPDRAMDSLEVTFKGRGPGTFWLWAGDMDVTYGDERGMALRNEGAESEQWVNYYARVPIEGRKPGPLWLIISWEENGKAVSHKCRFRFLSAEENQRLKQDLAAAEAVESPLARHLLSMLVYDDLDQLPQAIREAREALKLNPDDPNLHADMARLLIDAGRIREARKHDQHTTRE